MNAWPRSMSSHQPFADQFEDPPEEPLVFGDSTGSAPFAVSTTTAPMARPAKRSHTMENESTVPPSGDDVGTVAAIPRRLKVKRRVPPATASNIHALQQCEVNCDVTIQVRQATRLVSQHLRLFRELSPGIHLQAAAAIESFGRCVFMPYILAEANGGPISMEQDEEGGRIFYATLLALREVLAQNADKFFALPATTPTEGVNDTLSEKDLNEEQTHGKMLIATAIVMAACKAAGRDEDKLMTYMQDDFPADRADLVVNLRTPQGNTLPPEETLAWKVGFNLAQAKRATSMEQGVLPEPTACWMSMVEQIPASVKRTAPYDL